MANQITPNPSVPSQVVAEVKFPKFINNLGIIPTSYKDSMSYYECLAWLCKFLEEQVIPTVNENGEAVEELQALYVELNSYVTHYFETLDVQEEINNKLDDMVEAGTLQEIIADYLNSKAVFGYDNVESMLNATNLINGSYARTLGFYSKNDGGGAIYKIRTITNDDVVNNMDILEMEDSENQLIAELISDKNNILCYGVKSDDSNNNNHTIIKYVIDNNESAYCNKEITLTNTLILDKEYANFKFNIINYTGNSHAILINNNHIILNGEILNSNYDGLHVGSNHLVMWCNLKINSINAENIGILLGGTAGVYYNTFNILYLSYKIHGIKILLDDFYVGENNFYNINFVDNSDESITNQYAFHCNATNYRATGFKFYNVSIEGSKGGFYFEGNNKLCEYLHIFGLRCTEPAYRQQKVLKIKCNSTTIPLYGDIYFDNARPSSFDFSEYTVASNSALVLHGAFRNDFNNSNDILGYEGHPNYTSLVLTKLPRGYDTIRTANSPQILKASTYVCLLNSSDASISTIKLKVGDSDYVYNGIITFYNDNANITSIDIYANDGTTLIRSIALTGSKSIVTLSFFNQLVAKQTNVIASISHEGYVSNFA